MRALRGRGASARATRMSRSTLLAVPFAVALACGCRPPPVVGPKAGATADTAQRMVSTLAEAGIACEPTKESFVHCNSEGVDLVLGVTLAATGTQLTMVIPFHQPACAAGSYRMRLAKFNGEYFGVVAGCLNEKTLLLSHRSHLFKGGLEKKDFQQIVKLWITIAIGTASEAGLLAPAAPAEAPPEKATGETGPGKIRSW
jgi:hypothetical protein